MTEKIAGGWGLWDHMPVSATAAWGARAIFKNGQIDILPDRQDSYFDAQGGDEDGLKKAFFSALQTHAFPLAREAAKKAYFDGELDPAKANLVTLVSGEITVLADTRGSHGHLYIIAYVRTAEIDRDILPSSAWREDDQEHYFWSAKQGLPRLGQAAYCKVMNIGPCTVLGFRPEGNTSFLAAIVVPHEEERKGCDDQTIVTRGARYRAYTGAVILAGIDLSW